MSVCIRVSSTAHTSPRKIFPSTKTGSAKQQSSFKLHVRPQPFEAAQSTLLVAAYSKRNFAGVSFGVENLTERDSVMFGRLASLSEAESSIAISVDLNANVTWKSECCNVSW